MRVGIFFQADDTGTWFEDLLRGLKEKGVESSAYRLGRNWEWLDGDELVFNFQSLTHFIVVPKGDSFNSRWLSFVAGFATGGAKYLGFFSPVPLTLPHYLSRVKKFHQITDVVDFLNDEAEIWHKSNAIEQAREALVALGIGINEENFAARVAMGDDEAVENFLKVGYSPDTTNSQGVPAICLSVRNGHKKITQLLLDRNVNVNVLSQDRGNSPLMEAAVRGDQHSTRLFLEAGADPDLVSKSGQTAIMMAVGEGHKEIVTILLEYNAGKDFVDSLGMTARKYAQIFQHKEIMELLE